MSGAPINHDNGNLGNGTTANQPKIIVRAEEALIVVFVLALWIAAIALFFNRWGKIRMLEPYQPKFIQQHRPSCSLADPAMVQHRSFSKFNLNREIFFSHQKLLRPRQNSVFVGSSMATLPMNAPPRKVKSAFDLQNLIFSDSALNKSALKINCDRALRRQSLFPASPRRLTLDLPSNGDSSQTGKERERRMSFKDLIDMQKCQRIERAHCHGEKEEGKIGQSGETKEKATFSSQTSGAVTCDSRCNSITNQDLKLPLGIIGKDRKNSLLTVHRDFCCSNPRELESGEWRSDAKTGINSFRRNSSLLTGFQENDRNYLNLKSGVVDFRRNSMLIINNLAEDIGCRLYSRGYSLGGSNVALGSDMASAAERRNSAMLLSTNSSGKQKPSASVQVPCSTSKATAATLKLCNLHSGEIKSASRKPSKSLDNGDSLAIPSLWRTTKDPNQASSSSSTTILSDGRHQFLLASTSQSLAGSSASLNTRNSALMEIKSTIEESRSAGDLNSESKATKLERLNRDALGSSRAKERSAQTFKEFANLQKGFENKTVPTVNITASLTNLDVQSGTPLTIVTSNENNITKADLV